MRTYAFLRRPIWLAGVVIALGTIVLFVLLGFWQLRRLDERRALNAVTESRQLAPEARLDELIEEDQDEVEFRRIVVTGTYVLDEEVILQARSFRGLSGHHVLTPLRSDNGIVVLIDRGWVDADVDGPPVVGAEPPAGTVRVTGYVLDSEKRGSFGPVDPESGELDRVSRVDVERLEDQVTGPLAPFYVRLVSQEPDQSNPLPVPIEPLDEGPHLGYAVQWWLFAAVIAVGFPILLYRTAQAPTRKPVEEPLRTAEEAEV